MRPSNQKLCVQFAKIIQKLENPVVFKVSNTPDLHICPCITLGWLGPHLFRLAPVRLQVSVQDFKIQNIVGSCDVKFPIRLEGLSYTHSFFCSVSLTEPVGLEVLCTSPLRCQHSLTFVVPEKLPLLGPLISSPTFASHKGLKPNAGNHCCCKETTDLSCASTEALK